MARRQRQEDKESIMGFSTPEEAETAFYHAFEQRDLAAMMMVWSDEAVIECIHPFGPRVRGPDAVRESWRRIFADAVEMRFRLQDVNRIQGPLLAVHILVEEIMSGGAGAEGAVIATNIYQCTADGWTMLLHHASPRPREAQASTETSQSVH